MGTIDWSLIWTITIVGFLFVVLLLFVMVGIMKLFGVAFTMKVKKTAPTKMQVREEEIAAIATAISLYRSELFKRTIEVATIHNIKNTYSPWNSKIHGLTQMPEHINR